MVLKYRKNVNAVTVGNIIGAFNGWNLTVMALAIKPVGY